MNETAMENEGTREAADDAPIVCRPSRSNWWVVVFFGAVCASLLTLPLFPTERQKPFSTGDWIALCCLVALLSVLPLYFGLLISRAVVAVNGFGLCWRGALGRMRCVRWSEVNDYYELSSSGKTYSVIETSAGKLRLNSIVDNASQREALRRFIQAHATQARSKEWDVQGARPEDDWPQTFDYNTSDYRFMKVAPFVMPLLILLMVCMKAGTNITRVPQTFIEIFKSSGPVVGVLFALTTLVILSLYPLMIMAMLPSPAALRARRQQRITATLDSIVFEDAQIGRRLEATWDEITEYFTTLDASQVKIKSVPRHVVVTAQGEFDFMRGIRHGTRLRAIIRRYAVNAQTKKWQHRGDVSTTALGGETSRWSGGAPGVGQRIYSYRTRLNRALMWLPTFMALVAPLRVYLAQFGMVRNPEPVFDIVFAVLMCSLPLWGWWRYYAASIRIDEAGITQQTWRGPPFIAWDAVEEYHKSGEESYVFGNVLGAGTRIRFWLSIADAEELKEEIARRAVNSRTRKWEQV